MSWHIQVERAFLAGICVFSSVASAGELIYTEVLSTIHPLVGYAPAMRTPAIDGDAIAFIGLYDNRTPGRLMVYSGTGMPRTVTQEGVYVPEYGGSITSLNDSPSIDGDDVAFHAFTDVPSRGIFAQVDGSLRSVSGVGRWNKNPDIDNGRVLFTDFRQDTPMAIYLWHPNGTVETLVDADDFTSEGETYDFFHSTPVIEGNRVAFWAGGMNALYSLDLTTGNVQTRVGENAVLPGRGEQRGIRDFDLHSNPMRNELAFTANFTGGGGIYTVRDDEIFLVADTDTLVPGGLGSFGTFRLENNLVAIDGNTVAFMAEDDNDRRGLFARFQGDLYRVAVVGDVLDGRIIESLFWDHNGLSGNTLCFTVVATDGNRFLYTVTVPEPAAGLLMMFAPLVTRRRGRRSVS